MYNNAYYMLLDTTEHVREQLSGHVRKILLSQDPDGMIPSAIEFSVGHRKKKRDIVRQAMSTMALSCAQALSPDLHIEEQIRRSRKYVMSAIEAEPASNRAYIYCYLALEALYTNNDPQSQIAHIHEYEAELFLHPILSNLYLRIAALLPESLPHAAYLAEIQRWAVSTVPRLGRFFDRADVLVWAGETDPVISQLEYAHLQRCQTPSGWYKDSHSDTGALASAVAKVFEVLAQYEPSPSITEALYAKLQNQKATNQYALQVLGEYGDHILSRPNLLYIDDAHTHILMGLCYAYRRLLQYA
jgi:hypothetical protein